MAKYKVAVDQQACIGCGACTTVCSSNFEMADIKGEMKSRQKKTEITDKELECSKEAAEACPVNAIHITDKDTNEKII